MPSFTCPQCGHQSQFDPWQGPAHCPQCGFHPPTGAAAQGYVQWARRYAYQPFLQELQDYWHGRHRPEPEFTLESQWDATWFFREYRLSLGEDARGQPGPHAAYARDYEPTEREILIFAGAYVRLRRGDRAAAASELKALTFTTPEFVDPWVWLTATTDDAVERARYLERGARLDAAHPLARDALALIRGQVATARPSAHDEIVTAQCFQCGGAWAYRPGEGAWWNSRADSIQSLYGVYLPSFQVIGVTYQLVLLPVWVGRVGGGDAACLALVNDQTGHAAHGPRQTMPKEDWK